MHQEQEEWKDDPEMNTDMTITVHITSVSHTLLRLWLINLTFIFESSGIMNTDINNV